MSDDNLFLGTNLDTGRVVFVSDAQRTLHTQIIGASGRGKSCLLEHMIFSDIMAGQGLCLIDPHGYLYFNVLKRLQAVDYPLDRIILLDPSNDQFTQGFNPLHVSTKDLSYHVDSMVAACGQVWGGEDSSRTPLLKRCLRLVFHALAEQNLTLVEALYLTSPANRIAREYLTRNILDEVIQEHWRYFNSEKMTQRQFYEEVGSTINRIMEFLAATRIRNILGQRERALDCRRIMDEKFVLLVNLSSGRRVSRDNARLLGTLLVNDLFLTATERPPNSSPFQLYVDECGLFVNDDIAHIAAEARKFGLHLVLSHQNLSQLKRAGEDVYSSIMTNVQNKIVFGGLSVEDAKIMAETMFLGEIDLQEPKPILNKPTVVRYTTRWFNQYSRGEAFGRSETDSYSESSGSSSTSGYSSADTESYAPMSLLSAMSPGEMSPGLASLSNMRGYSSSFVTQAGSSSSSGIATSYQESSQQGVSEGLEPVLEDRPGGVYNLQEQLWRAMDTLVNQSTGKAIVKLPGILTKRIQTPFIEELPTSNDDTVGHYIERCNQISLFGKPADEAKREIEERRTLLLESIRQYELEKAAEQLEYKQRKRVRRRDPEPSEENASREAENEEDDGVPKTSKAKSRSKTNL